MLTDAQKRDPAYWLSAAVHGNWYGKYNSGGSRETAPGTIGDLSVGYVDLADRAAKAHDILVYMGVPGAQKIVSKWIEGIVGNGYSFANKDEERYVNGFLNAAGEGGLGAGILDSGLVANHWKSLPPADVAQLVNTLRDTLGANSAQFQQVVRLTQSQDPNDKLCPAGFGTNGFIRANSLMPYMIRFENDTNATAPAQQVSVVDPLSTNLDWTSFELTEVGFGDHIISVPAHSQYFETTVPMSYNGVDFEVDVYAGIDFKTGEVYADFYSIDPLTGVPPGVMVGFLPPEDGTGRGNGHISFTVRGKTNLVTGTLIRNVAYITFDYQEIISTDQINPHDASAGFDLTKGINTIDASAPVSSVAALPYVSTNTSFTVNWSGTDAGSGIVSYDLYVSTNGAAWKVLLTGTTNTSLSLTGAIGNSYGFYSIAHDGVGLVETAPTSADATIIIAPHLAPEFVPLDPTNQNQFVAVGQHISFTNTATSPDMPITYSLGYGAPSGASISTNGVFSWTPSCEQASTTNVITIWATDSYGIPLSNAVSFVVAVSECLQLNVGSTVLQVGQTSSVPVSIISTLNLTNLSFSITYPTNRFTNWVVTPALSAIGTTTVQRVDGVKTWLNLPAKSGHSFNGPTVVATLSFQALPASSAFVPLTPAEVVGVKTDGSVVGNSSGVPGRAVVIGPEPLLEAGIQSNATRMITVYGNPGSRIQMAYVTNVLSTNWMPASQMTLTNLYHLQPVYEPLPEIYYRAWEMGEGQ